MSSPLLLPAGARLVHVGPHKTGSTAIQVAFMEARDRLADHGVVYATGPGYRPRKAGWALGIRGRPAGSEVPPMSHWHQLVDDVAAAGENRVCVSNEDFGRATPEQIRTVVDGLGGDRVHVVAVLRRLDRYLPSQWQERVKAGDLRDYDTWLRTVLDLDNPEHNWDRRNVWYSHDVDALVGRWVEAVGEDRFTLIVSDDTDRELLPRSFEQMLGLPEGLLAPDPHRSNRGLSWAETELIRHGNQAVVDAGWNRAQRRRFLVRGVLADMQTRPTPAGPKSPPLPEWAVEQMRELSDRRVKQVRDLGVRVIGDAERMRMPDEVASAASGSGSPPTPTLEVDVAAHALASVMRVALGEEPAGEVPPT